MTWHIFFVIAEWRRRHPIVEKEKITDIQVIAIPRNNPVTPPSLRAGMIRNQTVENDNALSPVIARHEAIQKY